MQDLKLGLKWPNDIYYDGKQKIGGVLVTTSITGSEVTAAVGCGLNLDNRRPTTCLNGIIQDHIENGQCLSLETLLAVTFNEFERLLDMLRRGALEPILDLYHRNWLHRSLNLSILYRLLPIKDKYKRYLLHSFILLLLFSSCLLILIPYWIAVYSGAQVEVRDNVQSGVTAARILSLDPQGFLLVRKEDGCIVSVHPDGNSFDMLNGLIVPKRSHWIVKWLVNWRRDHWRGLNFINIIIYTH